MANDYCSSSDIKAQLPEDYIYSSTDYDPMLDDLCTKASRFVDREVGYWPGFFYPTTDSETRYYDGNNEQEIDIDPMVTFTSLAVSEEGSYSSSDYTTWTENTDFYTWPYNASALGEPIRRFIIDWNGNKLNFTRFKKALKVTGIFGYSASVPEIIQQVCIVQVMRWYMRAKQGYADSGANPEIGQMTYVKRLDPDIKEMLNSFMLDNAI